MCTRYITNSDGNCVRSCQCILFCVCVCVFLSSLLLCFSCCEFFILPLLLLLLTFLIFFFLCSCALVLPRSFNYYFCWCLKMVCVVNIGGLHSNHTRRLQLNETRSSTKLCMRCDVVCRWYGIVLYCIVLHHIFICSNCIARNRELIFTIFRLQSYCNTAMLQVQWT